MNISGTHYEPMSSNQVACINNCNNCGKRQSIIVTKDAFIAYERGAFVQDAFPELTPDQREFFFQTGICDKCWNATFADDEEED